MSDRIKDSCGGRKSWTSNGRWVRRIAPRFLLALCTVCVFASAAFAAEANVENSNLPERRRDQFPKEFGYAVFPYPYQLPGIGSGLSLVAGGLNIEDTYTDAYGIAFSGDVKGGALGVADIHLIPRTLIVDLGYSTVNKATVQSYSQRGMHSGKDDYRLLETADTEYYGARLTAAFYDRRFEVYGAWYEGASRLSSVRNKGGDVIIEAQDSPRHRGHTTLFGTRVDFTDDYADPRRGVRLDVTHTRTPPRGSGPDYYVLDYNTTGYIPLGTRNTLAFNLLRSDATVTRQGETDRAALEQELGLNCGGIGDPEQRTFCNQVIDNTIANNQHGGATSLGGFSRLRAYPQGRYTGAHTLFLGSEFRWNLTDEKTPFDIFIMSDVRTAIQLALFYETGVTSDVRNDLKDSDNRRGSYGAGLRIVTGSGVVFRADVAHGDEGLNFAVFIGYPWEI